MQAELIYNPTSGQVVVRQEMNHVLDYLTDNGWSVTLRETGKPGDATELARDAVRSGAEVVIAAGGDGTINEVANGLVHSDTALGVLPVGTSNSWALQMGIPALNPMMPVRTSARIISGLEEKIAHPLPANYFRKVIMNAAKVLVEGKTVTVDTGKISGRYFLMWAGIGLDAEIVESISAKGKRALGSWAFILPAVEISHRSPGFDIHLKLDGTPVLTKSHFIVVSNIQLYGGVMRIGAKACVNDNKLDVCVFEGGGFFTFVQHAVKILSHRHLNDPKVKYYQCGEIEVETETPLPVHVDGEIFTSTPITINVESSSLKTIVPKIAPHELFHLNEMR